MFVNLIFSIIKFDYRAMISILCRHALKIVCTKYSTDTFYYHIKSYDDKYLGDCLKWSLTGEILQ